MSIPEENKWTLRISDIRRSDAGFYMCQINTDPMMSQLAYLEVVEPPTILTRQAKHELYVSRICEGTCCRKLLLPLDKATLSKSKEILTWSCVMKKIWRKDAKRKMTHRCPLATQGQKIGNTQNFNWTSPQIPKYCSDKSESGEKWIQVPHWLIPSIWRILNQWESNIHFPLLFD